MYRYIQKKYGDCLFIILGNGEQRKYLESYSANKGIKNIVVFKGNRPPEEVADYIGTSDGFLVGSYYEGFSVAMVEAFASCRPIVSTNVSGAKDLIIEGKNGFIVNNRNPTTYAEAIYNALCLKSIIHVNAKLIEKYDERKM